MNKVFFILLVVIVGFLVWGFVSRPAVMKEEGKLKVVTSFYPLYFFASEIGGEKAEVSSIVPAGVEPHDYEPTAGDIAEISTTDLLIVNGSGIEGWLGKVGQEVKSSGVKVLEVGEGITLVNDPHIWLSPKLAGGMVKKIAESMIKSDPSNADYYEKRAENLAIRLSELHRKFSEGLSRCPIKEFVTSHNAFGYLAGEYNLSQIAIAGLSPDEEPSITDMATIIEAAKRSKVKYIFFETLVSPRLAETIATEVGVRTLVLNPLEGIEREKQQQGENYFTIMEDNLANLRLALECQ